MFSTPPQVPNRSPDDRALGWSKLSGSRVPNAVPPGMRDELPPHAHRQSMIGRSILSRMALFGYERVWLPMFEYEHVMARASQSVQSAVRFVDPESGEVVALRTDMTPQIARVVASRYSTSPPPIRLCYQGSVLRHRRERARNASQVVQAGAELVGVPGTTAEVELARVLCEAVSSTGLGTFSLEIGHAGVSGELLRKVPAPERRGIVAALSAKDNVVLLRRAERAGLTGAELRALIELPGLQGGSEVLGQAEKLLHDTAAAAPFAELKSLFDRLVQLGIPLPSLGFDLGDTPRRDYYTGVMLQVLAEGPGEPLAAGGRYDRLYARYGAQLPAAGFAIDVHNLAWALATAGAAFEGRTRLVAAAGLPESVLDALRRLGIACSTTDADLEAYARAWQFSWGLDVANGQIQLTSYVQPPQQCSALKRGSGGLAIAELTGARMSREAADACARAVQSAMISKA